MTTATATEERLLTVEELADYLRVQPSTVRTWSRQRRIPEVRVSSRLRRYRLSEVKAALEEKKPDRCD